MRIRRKEKKEEEKKKQEEEERKAKEKRERNKEAQKRRRAATKQKKQEEEEAKAEVAMDLNHPVQPNVKITKLTALTTISNNIARGMDNLRNAQEDVRKAQVEGIRLQAKLLQHVLDISDDEDESDGNEN